MREVLSGSSLRTSVLPPVVKVPRRRRLTATEGPTICPQVTVVDKAYFKGAPGRVNAEHVGSIHLLPNRCDLRVRQIDEINEAPNRLLITIPFDLVF